MKIEEQSEQLIAEIQRRILELIVDNPCLAIVQTHLETAALIGASVALELKDSEDYAPFSPKIVTLPAPGSTPPR